MRLYELFEALSPSQYRPLVKGWNKERYAEIFKDPKYKHNKNGTRVIIPLGKVESIEKSIIQRAVEEVLAEVNFDLVDYTKGIARNKKNGQEIKIGKVLTKLKQEDLLNKYTSDKTREAVNEEYIVVISRHPYDVAGMSTNRGWTSCMNLDNGQYKEFVPSEIQEGSVVAYVTKKNDPDLKNPTGRVMIKPFINVLKEDDVYFGIENRVYGTNVNGFIEAVTGWVDWVNNMSLLDGVAVLQLNPEVYKDDISKYKILGNDDSGNMRMLHADPDQIKTIEDPTEKEQLVAVSREPYTIKFIKNPTERVQMTALKNDWGIFYNLKNPSERVQLAAVSAHGALVKSIPNPSEAVAEAAIKKSSIAIKFIENPSEKLQLLAVSRYGASIKYLPDPSPAVQLAAVRNDDEALEHIKNPTPEAKAEHIKLYRS